MLRFAKSKAFSLAGDSTPLGYWRLTMKTQSNTLDPESCRFCMDAINCEEPFQPNHLHKLVQKRNSPRIPSCLKCGQLQIFPFGQDKQPVFPRRYNKNEGLDYIPSGESIPHTKRCTQHNMRFVSQVQELGILFLTQELNEGYKP
jgi:hypothetical protein